MSVSDALLPPLADAVPRPTFLRSILALCDAAVAYDGAAAPLSEVRGSALWHLGCLQMAG